MVAVVMSGCSIKTEFVPNMPYDESVEITAVGLGVLPNSEEMSTEQMHMLAVKASKMDAYRSLVEKVYGVKITSNVSIRSLAIENDSFKGRVDGLIQMAEIVEVRSIMDGGAYETTMKVRMTPEFRSYVLKESGGD